MWESQFYHLLGDLGQVTTPLSASVSSTIIWQNDSTYFKSSQSIDLGEVYRVLSRVPTMKKTVIGSYYYYYYDYFHHYHYYFKHVD